LVLQFITVLRVQIYKGFLYMQILN
jgi:hypothetical protein